jgi:putative acetyltransferase
VTANFKLRRAVFSDMEPVAWLHRHVRRTCFPYLPELYTHEEDLAFFQNEVFPVSVTWLAKAGDELIGFAAVSEGWIDHLYVEPSRHGQGVGSALLSIAKEDNAQLELWTLQRNNQARRFYERHGFKPVEFTDGTANEEQMPNVCYRWDSY